MECCICYETALIKCIECMINLVEIIKNINTDFCNREKETYLDEAWYIYQASMLGIEYDEL